MANPMRLIRKYQKHLMVFFGVLLMLSFIVGGVMVSATRPTGDSGDENRRVVSWQGGKLTRAEMNYIKRHHAWSEAFLQELVNAARVNQSLPKANPSLMQVNPTDQEMGDRDMLTILMLARKAESLDMRIGEEAVDQYLNLVCDSNLSDDEFRLIISNLTSDMTNLAEIKRHLETELLAVNMFRLLSSGFVSAQIPIVTPIQAYAFEKQRYQTVRCEMYEIPVGGFLNNVSDSPSNREIKDLYEEGRNREPDLLGERPGFRIPRRLWVEWVSADLESDILRPAADAISDDEILARYEQWITLNDPRVIDFSPVDPDESENNVDGDSSTDENSDNEATNPNGEQTTDPQDPSNVDDGSSDADTGDSTDGSGTGQDNSNSSTQVDDQQGDDQQGGDQQGGDDQSSINRNGNYSFVSTPSQDDTNSQGNSDTSGDVANQDQAQQTNQAGDDTNALPDLNAPTQEQGELGQEQGVRPPRPGQDTGPTLPDTNPPISPITIPGLDDPVANLPAPRERSLGEVRDDIIEELRNEKAEVNAVEAFKKLKQQYLANAANDFIYYEMDVEEDPDTPMPDRPDIEQYAKDNGLKYHSTKGLISFEELLDIEAFNQPFFDDAVIRRYQQLLTISNYLIVDFDQLSPYDEKDFRELGAVPSDNPTFVFWVAQTEDTYVPELDDCRDDVIRYWKMQHARELAAEEANRIAKRSNGSTALSEAANVSPEDVIQTEEFTWISEGGGNMAQGSSPFTLSSIQYRMGREVPLPIGETEELETLDDHIDNGFMESIFTIAEGEAGVAESRNGESFFVVKVVERGGLADSIVQDFAVGNTENLAVEQYRHAVAVSDFREFQFDFLRKLEDEMEVRWLNP